MSRWLRRFLDNIAETRIITALVVLIRAFFAATWIPHWLYGETTNSEKLLAWFDGIAANLLSEMCGALIMFVIIDIALRRRQEREAEARASHERISQLVRQLKSRDSGFALLALEELSASGALENGALDGVAMAGANLEGAELITCNLEAADLSAANLQEASLIGCNLKGANLAFAKLTDTNLHICDLRSANLDAVKLDGALLSDADLEDAHIESARFSDTTVLPDRSLWKPDCDLARFTDAKHPDFWRSDHPMSPAYRGQRASATDQNEPNWLAR